MSILVSDILTRAREYADMSDTDFVTDATALKWVNVGLGELYDLLLLKYQDYFVKRVIQETSAQRMLLPDDFFLCRKVFYLNGEGQRAPLRTFTDDELDSLDVIPASCRAAYNKYQIYGNELWLAAEPTSATDQLEIWYIPKVPLVEYTNQTLSFQIPNNTWEELLVLSVAIRMMLKEETDPSGLMALKATLTDQILKVSSQRNVGEPKRTRPYSTRFQRSY